MFGLIRDILTSDGGSLAVVLGVIIIICYAIYYITKHITTIKSDHSSLSKDVSKIDSSIDEIRKDMAYLKGSLDILKDSEAVTHPLLKSHSPISLTELGKKVANELDAENMIANNWDIILPILNKDLSGKTPYDVQQYCMEEISVNPDKFFKQEDLNRIKKYAFEHGRPVELYTRMIGILVRDVYLASKGIDLSEIDKSEK